MPTLKLSSITCEIPEETDKDEIYLVYRGQKIWPANKKFYQIDTDEVAVLNLELPADADWAELELWEYDYTSKDDHLGTFHIQTSDSGPLPKYLL